jgi:diguanylate cyclase (GGDEF)-like protein/PAS domain S-box-containing protein
MKKGKHSQTLSEQWTGQTFWVVLASAILLGLAWYFFYNYRQLLINFGVSDALLSVFFYVLSGASFYWLVLVIVFLIRASKLGKSYHSLLEEQEDLDKRLQLRTTQLSNANLTLQNEVNERRKVENNLNQRDVLVSAANHSTAILLSNPDWKQTIQLVLAQLGQASGVSRIYLTRIEQSDGATLHAIQLDEWTAQGTPPWTGKSDIPDLSFDSQSISARKACLENGQPYYALTKDLSGKEAEYLEKQNVISVLELPILSGATWWGLIGFVDCQVEHQWTECEIDALFIPVKVLGAVIQNSPATQDLTVSEESYRFITENSVDLITRHTPDGTCRYASSEALDMCGYTPDELIGHNFQEFIHSDDIPLVEEAFRLAATSKPGTPPIFRFRRKTGEYTWFETGGRRITKPDNDEVTEFILVTHNATGRMQFEESLRASEKKFRGIVEQSYDGIILLDEKGEIIEWNHAQETITGMSKDEVLGRPIWDVQYAALPEIMQTTEAYEEARLGYQSFLKTGQAPWLGHLMEQRYRRKDGTLRMQQVLLFPIQTEHGYMVCSINRDVTERLEFEDALAQERNLLRTLIDNLPDHVFIKDNEGRFVLANQAIARFMGAAKPEDLLGQMDTDFYPLDFAAKYSSDEQQVVQSGEAKIRIEESVPSRMGTMRTFLTTKVPLRDSEGKINGLIGIGQDITDSKEAAEALRQANDKMVQVVASLKKSNHEATLMNELGDLLQSCRNEQDVYEIMHRYASELFPDLAGGIFILQKSQNLLESVVTWGNTIFGDSVFSPEDCWGMRRGRVHVVSDLTNRLHCQHVNDRPEDGFIPYLCQPMNAQGEVLGLLHLQGDQNMAIADWKPLARSLAERVALALANLNLRENLHTQAIRDPLTNLYNRRFMEETLEREIHRAIRYHRPLGLIMVDIDNFKTFNDTFSYAAGDTLLKELGDFLQSSLRKGDVTCRYGGEEFILILPESSLSDTNNRANQLREDTKRMHVLHQGMPLGVVTISLGIASFPQHGKNSEDMLKAVDTALHAAKSGGRDRVSVAGES